MDICLQDNRKNLIELQDIVVIVQQNLSTQFVFFPFIKGTFKGTVEGDTLLAVNFVARGEPSADTFLPH